MTTMPPSFPDANQFVRLAEGHCHYRFDGPDDGPVLLLIHGATVPMWEFDRLIPYLHRAGFRTLCADLYGHGYSARPPVDYDHALFVRQLTELLDSVHPGGSVHVLGHSLGAALGARLVCAVPDRCLSLVLAGPLVNFTANKPATHLLKMPLLGEWLVSRYVVPMLMRRRSKRYQDIEDGRFVDKFLRQLSLPGFGRALLSMVRSGSLDNQCAVYRDLDAHDHPVFILRGEDDQIVTRKQIQQIRSHLPDARFRQVENTAHAFLLTNPETLAPIIIGTLENALVSNK